MSKVSIPDKLDFRDKEYSVLDRKVCTLKAVLVHLGKTANSGHYVAYKKVRWKE
jgi:uncharacterized UBP type Zn finger protein